MKDEETQNSFVASTQKDCQLLSATGSVHWEWFYGWLQAFGGYFPKYADQGEGKGTFKNIFLATYPIFLDLAASLLNRYSHMLELVFECSLK